MSDELDLGIALADVRKAYRLLWCYQKRVFDILRLIVSEFDDRRFYYWRSAHTDPPQDRDRTLRSDGLGHAPHGGGLLPLPPTRRLRPQLDAAWPMDASKSK